MNTVCIHYARYLYSAFHTCCFKISLCINIKILNIQWLTLILVLCQSDQNFCLNQSSIILYHYFVWFASTYHQLLTMSDLEISFVITVMYHQACSDSCKNMTQPSGSEPSNCLAYICLHLWSGSFRFSHRDGNEQIALTCISYGESANYLAFVPWKTIFHSSKWWLRMNSIYRKMQAIK